MLTLLQFISDKKEHSIREAIEHIATLFSLCEEERSELLPSGTQPILDNRVNLARTYLRNAGLSEITKKGHFRITERGLDVLKKNPSEINVQYLEQFPEFRAFQSTKKKGQPFRSLDNQILKKDWFIVSSVLETGIDPVRSEPVDDLTAKEKEPASRSSRRIKYVINGSNLQGGFATQIGSRRVYFRRPALDKDIHTRVDPDIFNQSDLVVMARVNENSTTDYLIVVSSSEIRQILMTENTTKSDDGSFLARLLWNPPILRLGQDPIISLVRLEELDAGVLPTVLNGEIKRIKRQSFVSREVEEWFATLNASKSFLIDFKKEKTYIQSEYLETELVEKVKEIPEQNLLTRQLKRLQKFDVEFYIITPRGKFEEIEVVSYTELDSTQAYIIVDGQEQIVYIWSGIEISDQQKSILTRAVELFRATTRNTYRGKWVNQGQESTEFQELFETIAEEEGQFINDLFKGFSEEEHLGEKVAVEEKQETSLAQNERYMACWPLPGKLKNYIPNLTKLLARIRDIEPTLDELASWASNWLGSTLEWTKNSIRITIVYTSLAKIETRSLQLTDAGQEFLHTKDPSIVLNGLLQYIWGIREILVWLKERPLTTKEILMRCNNLGVPWETRWQIRHRLRWLRALNIIYSKGQKYYLTETGVEVSKKLEREFPPSTIPSTSMIKPVVPSKNKRKEQYSIRRMFVGSIKPVNWDVCLSRKMHGIAERGQTVYTTPPPKDLIILRRTKNKTGRYGAHGIFKITRVEKATPPFPWPGNWRWYLYLEPIVVFKELFCEEFERERKPGGKLGGSITQKVPGLQGQQLSSSLSYLQKELVIPYLEAVLREKRIEIEQALGSISDGWEFYNKLNEKLGDLSVQPLEYKYEDDLSEDMVFTSVDEELREEREKPQSVNDVLYPGGRINWAHPKIANAYQELLQDYIELLCRKLRGESVSIISQLWQLVKDQLVPLGVPETFISRGVILGLLHTKKGKFAKDGIVGFQHWQNRGGLQAFEAYLKSWKPPPGIEEMPKDEEELVVTPKRRKEGPDDKEDVRVDVEWNQEDMEIVQNEISRMLTIYQENTFSIKEISERINLDFETVYKIAEALVLDNEAENIDRRGSTDRKEHWLIFRESSKTPSFKTQIQCLQCGEKWRKGVTFCGKCGTRL